jgi:Tetratricopeptide repeat
MRLSSRLLPLVVAALGAVFAPAPLAAQAEPGVSEVLASADEAWGAGKYDAAFERYQVVLRRDSTSARAAFRLATLLAWRNDLDHSVALFRFYLTLAPGDDDGRIGLARSLAWSGRYDQAIAICDSVVTSHPRQRDAALLAAQALAWSGNLRDAIGRYQRWLASHPDDSEAWVALAQSWRWASRADDARQALEHALTADPRNANAQQQLAWTRVALAASFEPTISSTDDSDDNRSVTYSVRGGLAAPWHARLVGDGSYRIADLATRHGTAATLRAISSFAPLNGQWTLRGELGASRLAATDAPGAASVTRIEPLVSARLSGRVAPRLSLGIGASHAAFDETAMLMLSGVRTTSIDADADVTVAPRLSLGGGGGWTRLSGGSGPNNRASGSGTLRWSPRSYLSLASSVRGFAYDHPAFDGYFAPKRYLLAELSSRVRLGGDLGWGLESELGLGNQTITAFDNTSGARFAQRASASVLYRPTPGVEWGLSGSFANVASPATVSSADYRAYSVALRGRVRL